MSKKQVFPPIRVGSRVTYCPAPSTEHDADGPIKDYGARIVVLTLDGELAESVPADIHDYVTTPRVFAQLRLSDGCEVVVPMKVFVADRPYWCRPWISSFTLRG